MPSYCLFLLNISQAILGSVLMSRYQSRGINPNLFSATTVLIMDMSHHTAVALREVCGKCSKLHQDWSVCDLPLQGRSLPVL